MKRLLLLTLISLLCLGVIACQPVDKPKTSPSDTAQPQTSNEEKKEKEDKDHAVKEENVGQNDENASIEESKDKTATIYFSDSNAMGLNEEKRTVESISPEFLIDELIKGPQNPDNIETIPEGTKLLSVEVKDKTAFVNFSKELRDNHWGGSTGEIITIYSIVNTLVLQPDLDIEKVQILIEGNTIETLAGHIDISMPIEPNLEMVDMK